MRRRGFTLTELLVSMALMGIITLAMIAIFRSASAAIDLGGSRMALFNVGREFMRRMAPFIVSSMPPGDDPSADSIMDPDLNLTASEVYVSTTEDWLDAAYPSATTSATMVDLANAPPANMLSYFGYKVYATASTTPGAPAGSLDVILERSDSIPPAAFVAMSPPVLRVLARSNEDVRITGLTFTRDAANILQVSMTLEGNCKGSTVAQRTVNVELNTALEVACNSLRSF